MSNHYHKLGTDYSHNVLMLTLLESHLRHKDHSVHVSGTRGGGPVLSREDGFSRFVKFQLSDFAVGGINGDLHLRAVLLVPDDFLDVDAPSSSVDREDLSDLALHTVLGAANADSHGIALSDWHGSAGILSSKLLAERAAHHLSSQAAWGGEVSLSGLSSLTGNTYTRWLIAKWITY